MFEFSVGEKEIHKVKVTFSMWFGNLQVFIDNNLYKQGGYSLAFEVGTNEKHFVFIQMIRVPFNFTINFDVFIDNKFLGPFNLK